MLLQGCSRRQKEYGLATKHFKTYMYADPYNQKGSKDCFERSDLEKYKVRKKDQLDSLPVFTNGMIKVMFDPAHIPRIMPSGHFNATLVDSKLMAASFTIKTADADEVFATLKKKYGTNVTVTPYQLQNGYGANPELLSCRMVFSQSKGVDVKQTNTTHSQTFLVSYSLKYPRRQEEPKEKRAL